MLLDHNGIAPRIDASARVAPTAVVCGDVTIGANTSIGFGVVLTAESGPIVIGANCVIMDTAVIRGVRGNPVRIGDNVLVGPRAYLTGCEVADNVFLATGTTIFNGARIGTRATVRIKASFTSRPCSRLIPWCPSTGLQWAIPRRSFRHTSTRKSGLFKRNSISLATSSACRESW